MTTLLLEIQATRQAVITEQELVRVAEWQRREGISYARRESFARVLRIRRRK